MNAVAPSPRASDTQYFATLSLLTVAVARIRLGDREGADSAARAALALDPADAAALTILGRSGNDDRVETSLE